MTPIYRNNNLDFFIKALCDDRLAHSYLFLGQESYEKKEHLKTIAKLIICFKRGLESHSIPCEKCSHCKKINSSSHPDYIVVEPQGRFIKIEQIRQLQDYIKFPPLEAKRRVCIIYCAHQLHPGAANALLKTLEEPPGDTYFLLSATSTGSLLPTIVSRCQIIRVNLDKPTSKISFEHKVLAYDISLKDKISNEEVALIAQKIFSFLTANDKKFIYFDCIQEVSKGKDALRVFLIIFKFILRDILILRSLKTPVSDDLLKCNNHISLLIKLAQTLNYDTLKGLEERLKESELFLNRNVKSEMIADRILIFIIKNFQK